MAQTSQRFHRPSRQSYAADQLRDRHTESLYRRGEYAMFVLMWRVADFEADLVVRCERCVDPYGSDVAAAFGGQPAEENCPDCYGTGFEGGYRAKIVRPSIWEFPAEDDELLRARGVTDRQGASVQSTFDFALKTGDHILRNDGTRWYARAPRRADVATGFGGSETVGFNYTTVDLEPLTSVAYLIEPTTDDLIEALRPPGHGMVDFSGIEEIRTGAVLL